MKAAVQAAGHAENASMPSSPTELRAVPPCLSPSKENCQMRRLVHVAIAAASLACAIPAFAQSACHPNEPLSVSITVAGGIASSAVSDYINTTIASSNSSQTSSSTADLGLGGAVSYDVYRTPNRRDPLLFSVYYEYMTVGTSYTTTVPTTNQQSTTADPGSLVGYGPGIQARVYFGVRSKEHVCNRMHNPYLSVSTGYYHLFGSQTTTSDNGTTTSQHASAVAFGTKIAFGMEVFDHADVSLGVGLFPSMGITGFTASTPILLNAGWRF
jgi:hypothetical protein